MVNDAAQYFARYIHDNWSKYLAQEQDVGETSTNIVLIFISTMDRICYISSGNRIGAILPWWRLEHVVQDMKPYLQNDQIGNALYMGIEDLSKLLITGPPSFTDRLNDFLERFGVVVLFTIFTFVFATWGECRDRRKRFFLVEGRSQMTAAEKEKARLLQVEFRSQMVRTVSPLNFCIATDYVAGISYSFLRSPGPPPSMVSVRYAWSRSIGLPKNTYPKATLPRWTLPRRGGTKSIHGWTVWAFPQSGATINRSRCSAAGTSSTRRAGRCGSIPARGIR